MEVSAKLLLSSRNHTQQSLDENFLNFSEWELQGEAAKESSEKADPHLGNKPLRQLNKYFRILLQR